MAPDPGSEYTARCALRKAILEPSHVNPTQPTQRMHGLSRFVSLSEGLWSPVPSKSGTLREHEAPLGATPFIHGREFEAVAKVKQLPLQKNRSTLNKLSAQDCFLRTDPLVCSFLLWIPICIRLRIHKNTVPVQCCNCPQSLLGVQKSIPMHRCFFYV